MQKYFLQSRGLAEINPSPTKITHKFHQCWFTTQKTFGKALDYLQLPHIKNDLPLIVRYKKNTYQILNHIEKSQFGHTLLGFKYSNNQPKLKIQFNKFYQISKTINTFKILYTESLWSLDSTKTESTLQKLLNSIDTPSNTKDLKLIEASVFQHSWPQVIAIGIIAEQIHNSLLQKFPDQAVHINQYLSHKMKKQDFFYQALNDQYQVKQNLLSFTDYIAKYGSKSDNDFDFFTPRWHEIPDTIKKRISNSTSPSISKTIKIPKKIKQHQLLKVCLKSQIIRSQARQKMLFNYNSFRQALRYHADSLNKDPETIVAHFFPDLPKPVKLDKKTIQIVGKEKLQPKIKKGEGTTISIGKNQGKIIHLNSPVQTIPPESIGIIDHSSSHYTHLIPKLNGIIFLTGSITSHGAIIAREFSIPAIISKSAANLSAGTLIYLNATKGQWHSIPESKQHSLSA